MPHIFWSKLIDVILLSAMTAAQSRLADTIEAFYGSADKTSEGAMAGHAYKRSVDDLDGAVGRELASLSFYASGLQFIVFHHRTNHFERRYPNLSGR